MKALLPPHALFVNFGRGNLVKSGTYHFPLLPFRFFEFDSFRQSQIPDFIQY
jgi:hypothetical protein